MYTHGTFVWNELATTDIHKAKEFYTNALGWEVEQFPVPEGEYLVVKVGDKYIAGVTPIQRGPVAGATEPYWFPYIEVEDIDARIANAVASGASVVRPAFDMPNVGRIAILRDPTGAAMGWMTSVKAAVPA